MININLPLLFSPPPRSDDQTPQPPHTSHSAHSNILPRRFTLIRILYRYHKISSAIVHTATGHVFVRQRRHISKHLISAIR